MNLRFELLSSCLTALHFKVRLSASNEQTKKKEVRYPDLGALGHRSSLANWEVGEMVKDVAI